MKLSLPDLVSDPVNRVISKGGIAVELCRQAVALVANLSTHFGKGVINLICDRKLEAPDVWQLMHYVDTDTDFTGISKEGMEALDALKIPPIFYEMLQGIRAIRSMPKHEGVVGGICDKINRRLDPVERKEEERQPRIYVAGEGSSIAIPGALATKFSRDIDNAVVVSRCCSDITDICACDTVIILSNSGMTDTAVRLAERANGVGALTFGITKDSGSELARVCGKENTIILNCGTESAVGATKSVVEQCFVVSEIIRRLSSVGYVESNYDELAEIFSTALTQEVPQEIIRRIAFARQLVIIGNHGVHREAALKAAETIGLKVRLIDSSFALHGDEETFGDGDVVLFIEPDLEKLPKIGRHIASRVPVFYLRNDIGVADEFSIPVPKHEEYQPVMNLGVVQNLLIRLAIYKGCSCEPQHCRKVGDAVELQNSGGDGGMAA
jgi:fructoselysine-6-P-deglycase FrlB-like protein